MSAGAVTQWARRFVAASVVDATYRFYPPTVGTFPAAPDRTAFLWVAFAGLGLNLGVFAER